MTAYINLEQKKKAFFEIYRCACEDSRNSFEADRDASVNIQRVFRGTRSRERIAKMNYAAAEIERVFRGRLGRKRATQQQRNKLDGRQLSLYFYLCIQIQKNFRGFYSRKYKHDLKRRKRECLQLEGLNERLRTETDEYARSQAQREEDDQASRKDSQFRSLAQNLHHLMSTRHIRGVYNPSSEYVAAPRMNGLPVEDHVRGVVRDLLRTRGVAKTGGLVPDIHGTRKIPLKGLKYRLSIQASAPYDTVEKEKRRDTMLHRILTAGKGNFVSGGTTRVIDQNPVPLSVGDPFLDSWANPLLVKGVPRDQQQLMESSWQHKALFARPAEKPFVSRVGGNKSAALANDLFDVIAEAQETGGAAQRQLGTGTTRFGLPASVDNRLDGTIPMPPIRASATVKSTRPKIRNVSINVKAQTMGSALRGQQAKRLDSAVESGSEEGSGRAGFSNYDSSDDEQ